MIHSLLCRGLEKGGDLLYPVDETQPFGLVFMARESRNWTVPAQIPHLPFLHLSIPGKLETIEHIFFSYQDFA